MTSKSQICGWDFTCKAEEYDLDKLKSDLSKLCKKWCFQLEEGATGYKHYQGRVSLKAKTRSMFGVLEPIYWSPTSCSNRDNEFYVTKEETRLDGPWSDRDKVIYIPRQVREIEKLKPWQQKIVDRIDEWDTRTINVVFCRDGNIGKSTLCSYLRAYELARVLPPLNDMKDIMRMVCDLPTSRCYVFDMPRCMKKEKLFGFYSGVEMLKDGYAYDDRHNFKEKVFDCPNIWIFSNMIPDRTLLSADRWKVHMISGDDIREM